MYKNIHMLSYRALTRNRRRFIKFGLLELNKKFAAVNLFDKCLDKSICKA